MANHETLVADVHTCIKQNRSTEKWRPLKKDDHGTTVEAIVAAHEDQIATYADIRDMALGFGDLKHRHHGAVSIGKHPVCTVQSDAFREDVHCIVFGAGATLHVLHLGGAPMTVETAEGPSYALLYSVGYKFVTGKIKIIIQDLELEVTLLRRSTRLRCR
jgi:hypothetical protein